MCQIPTKARYPLLAAAMIALLAGQWSGLQRIGWVLPVLQPSLAGAHGPVMICGFLGTLISLERAVALDRWWGYLAPALSGIGGLSVIASFYPVVGAGLIAGGSLILVVIFATFLRGGGERFTQVMALGALLWMGGNVAWLVGMPINELVYSWMGFLVLTIAGERLELSRMMSHRSVAMQYFNGATAVFMVGLVAVFLVPDAGVRLLGVGLIALAVWLIRYDVARRTVKTQDLPQYIAVCLLTGYAWMAAGGLMLLAYGARFAGPVYDAALHAVFVGFVMAMIFGHAPIIFPSVLNLPIAYRPIFYSHLGLLHLSLIIRITGDLAGLPGFRRWGGLLNAVSILLFLANTLYSVIAGLRSRGKTAGSRVASG